MGITLHGIVEVWIDASEHRRACWEDVATVEFNKNYELFHGLKETIDRVGADEWRKRDWYSRAFSTTLTIVPNAQQSDLLSYEARRVIDQDISCDATWVTPDELTEALKVKKPEARYDWRITAGATLAFMREFERHGYKVRILFYRIS